MNVIPLAKTEPPQVQETLFDMERLYRSNIVVLRDRLFAHVDSQVAEQRAAGIEPLRTGWEARRVAFAEAWRVAEANKRARKQRLARHKSQLAACAKAERLAARMAQREFAF